MVYPERRRGLRVDAKLNVKIEFIFPEEVFPSQDMRARSLNIGEQGMKLRLADVSENFYARLIGDLRSAKVSFALPTTKATNRVLGEIVWSNFDPKTRECLFGLNFKRVKPEIRQNMHDYIEVFRHPKSEPA